MAKLTKKEIVEGLKHIATSSANPKSKITVNRCQGETLEEKALHHLMTVCANGNGFHVTEANNKNSYILKMVSNALEETERFVADKRTKFRGMIGFGSPQLKRMLESFGGEYASFFCGVRQGTKNYWFTEPWKVTFYLVSKYQGEQFEELTGMTPEQAANMLSE